MSLVEQSTVVRALSVADLEEALTIERDAFVGADCPAVGMRQLHELFADAAFLAVAARQPAGYAIGGLDLDGQDGWLLSIAVARTHRRTGVGGALVDAVLAALVCRGAARVSLSLHAENVAMAALARSRDFDHDHHELGYFGPGRPRLVLSQGFP